MEGTKTSLWLVLLLIQLPFYPTDADVGLQTMPTHSNKTKDQGSSSATVTETSLTTTNHTNSLDTDANGNCLINTEMGLIAIGSAGALISCLLVTIVVLACQVFHMQRRVNAPRTSRSNMDLVGSTGYWGTDQPEAGGLVGPCDASVMLEEVRAESNVEIQEAREEAGHEEGATATAFDPEEMASQMKSSGDSCHEITRALEDMPLVV